MNNNLIKWGRKWQPRYYINQFESYEQLMLIVVTGGHLNVEFDDKLGKQQSLELNKGMGILLGPESRFCLSTPRSAYNGHWMEMDRASSTWDKQLAVFQADDAVQRVVNSIEQEYQQTENLDAMPILHDLLRCRCLQRLDQEVQKPASLVNQIDVLLLAHCRMDSSLQQILAHLPASERHIRRQYTALTGKTIKQRFSEFKMQEAKTLLEGQAFSITGIAFELGYPSSQYFAGVFKKMTGMTPSQYRTKNLAHS